jgi:hypothetical protein
MDTNSNRKHKRFVDRYVHYAYLGSIVKCTRVLHIGVHAHGDPDTVEVTAEQHRDGTGNSHGTLPVAEPCVLESKSSISYSL